MLTLHSTRYQQRDLFNNLHSSKSTSDRATALRFGATIGGGPPSPLRGATQVGENARLSEGMQDRLAATASLRRGSPTAENNQDDGGLVYFQETEAEEIIDMSELARGPTDDFVFRDEPESDNENEKYKPSSSASKFKFKQGVSEGSSYNKKVGITLGNSYQSSKKNPISSYNSSSRSFNKIGASYKSKSSDTNTVSETKD